METSQLALILERVFPACTAPGEWALPLKTAMDQYSISADKDFIAAFLAQVGTESGELNHLVENLNYSAEALMRVWPKRFPTIETAQRYARQPVLIANYVYANRLGNGDEASGDGWRYRGRGLIQVTGKTNQQTALAGIGYSYPETLESKPGAALSAAWFWHKNPAFNKLADDLPNDDDAADFFSITRLVNGGTIGLAQRKVYWERLKAALA